MATDKKTNKMRKNNAFVWHDMRTGANVQHVGQISQWMYQSFPLALTMPTSVCGSFMLQKCCNVIWMDVWPCWTVKKKNIDPRRSLSFITPLIDKWNHRNNRIESIHQNARINWRSLDRTHGKSHRLRRPIISHELDDFSSYEPVAWLLS